jgi:hypothetical protein
MTLFRIVCYKTKSYALDIEAPTKTAAAAYYDKCDTSAFYATSGEEWELDGINLIPAPHLVTADVTVDEHGQETPSPVLGTCDVCGSDVRMYPGGTSCPEGHGGAPYTRTP